MQPHREGRPAAAAGSFALTSPEPEPQSLSGLVERVAFHNAATGFCVLRVKLAEQRDPVTVVGECARVAPGEVVHAHGEWQTSPSYGLQFRARTLVAFRVIYYLVPFLIGCLVLAIAEFARRQRRPATERPSG